MDTSEEYIKKLSSAHEITYLKYEIGFNEGDFVWNGETVNVCGMDYIQVNRELDVQKTRGYFNGCIQFAIVEDIPMSFDMSSHLSELNIKYGTYKIKTICNPLWLPRQDQLQEMVMSNNIYEVLEKFMLLVKDENTMEQAWLGYVMMVKFNKVWNINKWVSI